MWRPTKNLHLHHLMMTVTHEYSTLVLSGQAGLGQHFYPPPLEKRTDSVYIYHLTAKTFPVPVTSLTKLR